MAEHSNLPAPYESPWRQLGRAVAAVLASLRLDARGLWRRNRAGELPRPIWWPRDLVPLFWPLLLVGALALAVALGTGLTLWHRTRAAEAPAAGGSGASQELAEAPLPLTPPPLVKEPVDLHPSPEPPPPALASNAPQPAPADPLLAAMAQGDGQGLVNTVTPAADKGLLQLRLGPAYGALDPGQQRRQAETWLQRSQDQGFDQLELIAADGRMLGYRARVGSGMILLDPNHAS